MAPQGKGTIAPEDIESGEFGVEKTLDDYKREDFHKCWLCRLTKCCICLGVLVLMVGAVVTGISVAFTGDPNPANYFVPVDPPGVKEAVRWDATAGLYLTVENACDESWTPFFDQSILEWNEGEALILRTEKVPYDEKCNPSRGRLKVCNGNYGPTDWRGLNTNVLSASTGFVVYSVSKLNDFHLQTDDDKAYTMCHENGHGFGLPHTDEDHYNRDRGDCLDYSTRPWNNLVPGEYNLQLLETLYGTPTNPLQVEDPLASDGSTSAPSTAPRRPPPPPPRPWDKEEEEEEDKDKDKDDRRLKDDFMPSFDAEIAAALENCTTSRCEHKLDEEFTLVINKLLVA